MQNISAQKFERELKKGGAELLVLSLLEARRRAMVTSSAS
jgi:hypothetical protein